MTLHSRERNIRSAICVYRNEGTSGADLWPGGTMLQLRRSAIVMVTATALVSLTGCGVVASEQGSFDRTLTVSGPARLELSNGSGAVQITGGQSGKIHVHAEVRVQGLNGAGEIGRAHV